MIYEFRSFLSFKVQTEHFPVKTGVLYLCGQLILLVFARVPILTYKGRKFILVNCSYIKKKIHWHKKNSVGGRGDI